MKRFKILTLILFVICCVGCKKDLDKNIEDCSCTCICTADTTLNGITDSIANNADTIVNNNADTIVNNIPDTINEHDYVDLGLTSGLKWATCNIGAASPSDYGNYYAWGETETKSEYTEDNSITYGLELGDISGNPQYDAARANWGGNWRGNWRMPTISECKELVDECTWEWTTQNGHNGYKVTGPNEQSIFLPAAGARDGISLYDAEEAGYYSSGTPHEGSTQNAYYYYTSSGSHYTSGE